MANYTRVNLIYRNNYFQYLEVKDHANYNQYGKDVVCAGISSVVFGFLNAIDTFAVNIDVQDAHIIVKSMQENIELTHYANLLEIQLETISHSYPKNLKITVRKE